MVVDPYQQQRTLLRCYSSLTVQEVQISRMGRNSYRLVHDLKEVALVQLRARYLVMLRAFLWVSAENLDAMWLDVLFIVHAQLDMLFIVHMKDCYHQWRIWSYMLFLLCHNINDVIMHSWNELTSSSRQDDTLLSSRKKRHAQYLHIGYQDNYTNSSKWTVGALNSLKYTSGKLNMNSPELEHGITYTLTFY